MVLFDLFNYTQWRRNPADIENWMQNNIYDLISARIWIIPIHQYKQYQLMLIIDPGTEICRQMLFDSLIGAKGMSGNRIQLSNYENYLV
jgi:hypothetical protein